MATALNSALNHGLDCAQVCGVFTVLLTAVHMLMYWGLYCFPALRAGFMIGAT